MKRIAQFAGLSALLLVTTGPAFGGYHYTARTWMEGDDVSEVANLEFEAFIDGEDAMILFHESGNPFIKKGNRIVTRDAGRTLLMVDDENKTYSEWDLEGWMSSIGTVVHGLGPVVKIKIENPKVETLVQEPGGVIAGHRTEHYRFRTSYDLKVKVIGIGQSQHVESIQDSWVTQAVDDPAIGVWIQRDPPDMGDTGFNELVKLEMSKQRGFPVKTIVEQVTTGKKGKETTSRTITQVDLLEEVPVASERFAIGSDYQRVAATPFDGTQAQNQDSEDDGEGKKKGRFRRLLKRDGG